MIAEDVHPQMAEIIWHSKQLDKRKDLLINIAIPSPPLGAKLLNMTPLSDLSQGRKHSQSKEHKHEKISGSSSAYIQGNCDTDLSDRYNDR